MKSSVAKRIKITKNGKIIRRKMGQGHSLAKLSGKQEGRRKRHTGLNLASSIIKKLLY